MVKKLILFSFVYYQAGILACHDHKTIQERVEKRGVQRDTLDAQLLKAKTKAVNNQIAELYSDPNWDKRREVIKKAVEQDGIHPDSMKYYLDFPLREAVYFNDLEFAQFLLEYGANPHRKNNLYGFLLGEAKTIAMAELLYQHGAQETIKNNGVECLVGMVPEGSQFQSELIPWYLNKGVDVNGYHHGQTALMSLASWSPCSKEAIIVRATILVQAGALLSLPLLNVPQRPMCDTNGYNVPQLIEHQMIKGTGSAFHENFLTLKNALIKSSDERRFDVKDALDNYFPSVLSGIIEEYWEEYYEELQLSSSLPEDEKALAIKKIKSDKQKEAQDRKSKKDAIIKQEVQKKLMRKKCCMNIIKAAGFSIFIGAAGFWTYQNYFLSESC